MPPDPLVSTSLRGWLAAVLGVLRRSGRALAAIHAVGGLVVALLGAALLTSVFGIAVHVSDPATPPDEQTGVFGALVLTALVVGVVALAGSVVVLGASTSVALRHAAGRPAPARVVLAFARGRSPRVVAWVVGVVLVSGYLLSTAAGLLTASGGTAGQVVADLVVLLVYLVLAGLLLSTSVGVAVLERRGPGRMVALVRRAPGATAARVLLFLVPAGAYAGAVTAVVRGAAGAIVDRAGDTLGLFAYLVLEAGLVALPLSITAFAVSLVTYAGLRHREDPAVGTAQLAAELDR